jgi:predicted ester cyclase
MSTEENKARTRSAYDEFINKGNVAAVEEYIAPNYLGHVPGLPPIQGVEGFKQFITMLETAFSDRHVTIEDMVAEGDKVAVRYSQSGTHTGELMGLPPTGKQVRWTGMAILRIADGKAVEQWISNDDLGLMQQLGVIPVPGGEE